LFLLMAMIGLAFDFGRIYIAHNEAQIFTDAAALSAAIKLDGTAAGIEEARQAVANLPARWNFGTNAFQNVRVEFSAGDNRWTLDPVRDQNTDAITRVRVTAPPNGVDIVFLRVAGAPEKLAVAAHSVAARNPLGLVE